MVHDLLDMLLNAVCQYFIENFPIYIHLKTLAYNLLLFFFVVVSFFSLGMYITLEGEGSHRMSSFPFYFMEKFEECWYFFKGLVEFSSKLVRSLALFRFYLAHH
jgi:hypothetical protein